MSSVPAAPATALASSVFPTPAGPSIRMGLFSRVARKTTVASFLSETYLCLVSRSPTSSMLSNKKSPSQNLVVCVSGSGRVPAPACCSRRCAALLLRCHVCWRVRGFFVSLCLVEMGRAAHSWRHAPDGLAEAVASLANHGIVDAVAQDLLRCLDGEVTRVPRRTQVFHHVLGHRLELLIVTFDPGRPLLVELARAHLRLRVPRIHLGKVLGDAAVPGEPYHRVYRLIGGLDRAQAPSVLTHRRSDIRVLLWRCRLIVRPHTGDADAVVQAVVDVVVGAHRVRERVQDPEKGAGEGLRGYVLRPTHSLHRIVVVWVVGSLA